MEFVLLDDGILLKPKVEKKEKSEMIDKYIPRDQTLENEIISLLSELKSRTNNELIIEEKCPR